MKITSLEAEPVWEHQQPAALRELSLSLSMFSIPPGTVRIDHFTIAEIKQINVDWGESLY